MTPATQHIASMEHALTSLNVMREMAAQCRQDMEALLASLVAAQHEGEMLQATEHAQEMAVEAVYALGVTAQTVTRLRDALTALQS